MSDRTEFRMRDVWRRWNVGRGCSPGKRYQRIRICLTGEVETPSSPIRRQAPDVKYPEKVECHPDRISAVIYPEKMERRKGDYPHMHGLGTPPPDDTEHASLSGATPSGFSKRICGALPYLKQLHPDSGFVYGKGLQSFGSSCF